MSKTFENGKWRDTTTGQVLEPVRDMPGDQQVKNPNLERHIPRSWVLAIYGIPQTAEGMSLRRKLCRVLKTHGLQSIDRGGSVYLGPANPHMDEEIRKVVDKLRQTTGLSNLVNIFNGEYDGLTAGVFLDKVTGSALADMNDAERLLDEFERAMAGQVQIKNSQGKDVDLVSTGYGRISTAKWAIEEVDSVLARFSGTEELRQEADRLSLKVRQLRSWVTRVDTAFGRFAKTERARRAADGNQEVA